MKTFFRFTALVLVLLIILIVLFNISNTIALESRFLSLRANVGFLILFCAAISSIATLLFLMSLGSVSKNERERFKKEVDKAKLNCEVESEKVKQLEAKIKTLEEAVRIATTKK